MDAHLLYTQQNPSRPTEHEISIATLPRLSRDQLAKRILASMSPSSASITNEPSSAIAADVASKTAVVDVRDNDYIGGHIKGCINVPSNTLDYKMPELVRRLGDKEVVVFHCALSQVRGPSAALKYMRERERMQGVLASSAGGDGEKKEQKVFVLDGGFTEWQQKYGEDIRLTEGYEKDIWAYGGY